MWPPSSPKGQLNILLYSMHPEPERTRWWGARKSFPEAPHTLKRCLDTAPQLQSTQKTYYKTAPWKLIRRHHGDVRAWYFMKSSQGIYLMWHSISNWKKRYFHKHSVRSEFKTLDNKWLTMESLKNVLANLAGVFQNLQAQQNFHWPWPVGRGLS